MPSYAGSSAARPGDVAGTLRLLAFLLLAVALMVLDHRGGWLPQLREHGHTLMQPLWWLAALPGRVGENMRQSAVTREQLIEDNRTLRNALLISGARVARLQAAASENARMRELLDAARGGQLDVQLVPILDIDLDPTRKRLMLAAGSGDGVHVGQTVIDAGGLLGQVIAMTGTTATVLLLTDPEHVVPATVARSGVRLLVHGIGAGDRLQAADIPLSADLQVGDEIITSGLGGRFPPGFAVGRVVQLRPDESRAFLIAELAAAANFDRGREVLLLRREPAAAPAAPLPTLPPAPISPAPTPAPANTEAPAG